MAHSIDCPACSITIRLSDDTFAQRIDGRRVKITCKGCKEPFFIDATGVAPRASMLPPPGVRRSSRPPAESLAAEALEAPLPLPEFPRAAPLPSIHGAAPVARVPQPPPLPQGPLGRPVPKAPPPPPRPAHAVSQIPELSLAPSLAPESVLPASYVPERTVEVNEEELPTRPRNERDLVALETPSVFYEPPPTSRSLSRRPPLSIQPTPEVIMAMSKRRPKRRYAFAAAALVLLAAGTLAARPGVRQWVATLVNPTATSELARNVEPTSQNPSTKGAAAERIQSTVAEPAASPVAPEVVAPAAAPEVKVAAPLALVEKASAEKAPAEKAAVGEASTATQVEKAEPSGDATPAVEKPAGEAAQSAVPTETDPAAAPQAAVAGPFDKSAAVTALQVASAQAASCRKAGDPTGMARVVVTFAPSGRVTSATVSGAPFAGTQTGGCIASQFRSARVPAFEGSLVTVTRSVVVQ